MTSEQLMLEPEPRPAPAGKVFDMRITLGNMITIVTIVVSLSIAWANTETKADHHADLVEIQKNFVRSDVRDASLEDYRIWQAQVITRLDRMEEEIIAIRAAQDGKQR